MCQICRDLSAAYHQLWREDHRARGLCTECVERRKRGDYVPGARYMKCDHHLEYHREWSNNHYAEKRAKGLCAYGACTVRSGATYMCDEHREAQNARSRRAPATTFKRLPFRGKRAA